MIPTEETIAGFVLKALLALPLLLAVAAWAGKMLFMLRAGRHVRDLEETPRSLQWNPFNIVVRPDLWTPEAERDCIGFWISVLIFVGMAAAWVLLGGLLG